MPSSLRNQPSSEDQRNVIVATILVAVIMFVWMFYLGPTPAERTGVAPQDTTQQTASGASDTSSGSASDAASRSSASQDAAQGAPDAETSEAPADAQASARRTPPADSITARATQGTARDIVVETDRYTAILSTKGGTLKRFTLKEYLEFNQEQPIQIIDTTSTGALGLAFTTPTSRLVDTRQLFFTPSIDQDTIRVGDDAVSLTFTAELGAGELQQTYTFHPDDYDLGYDVTQVNASSFATGDGYEVVWDGGLPFSEGGTDDERQYSGAFAYTGGELESVTLTSDEDNERSLNGAISWLSVKNKYFASIMMPDDPSQVRGADLLGSTTPDDGVVEHKKLEARLQLPSPSAEAQTHTDTFHFYLGPLYYYELAKYDRELYDMVDYGWDFFEWMTRPLAKWLFIPMLTYLGGFLPYGIVVILMAVFVKVVVYPLTKSSYRSMAQMRDLQPRMQELREEHEDDPQKQQEEMMKLYRETGVNPLGGCLPMLLQYPVIIALYQFIPQSIQLRQKSFLWANDLSAPDVILQLPFEIPFYGDFVAGFTLLMGLSMIVTMRLQSTPGSAGGQAKVFMYAMPAVIFFIFNRFASALSLYYLFYNIVTAIQQKWINYQLDKEKEDEETASSNGRGSKKDAEDAQKKGFFQKLLEKAEAAQKEQR